MPFSPLRALSNYIYFVLIVLVLRIPSFINPFCILTPIFPYRRIYVEMNHKPTLWSMKPKYGGVLALCKKLGYGSDTKDARNWFKLKTRLIEHRKEFAASSMARGTQFPLYYDHVEAQRCATLFLKNNGELFSQEEEGFIGPTLFANVHDGLVTLAFVYRATNWCLKSSTRRSCSIDVCTRMDHVE